MLHLARHDGLIHTFRFERLDELSKLPQRHPVNGLRVLFDFGKRFFLDRSHDHVDSLAPRRFQHEEGKLSIPRNQTVFT